MYQVEKVVGKKYLKNKLFYRLKWKGYSLQQSTWEKYSNLKDLKDKIEEFEIKHAQKLLDQNNSDEEEVSTIIVANDACQEKASVNNQAITVGQDPQNHTTSINKASLEEKDYLAENELKRIKFNFNQEQLLQALNQPNHTQKSSRNIEKKKLQKKLKKLKKINQEDKRQDNHTLQEKNCTLASQKESKQLPQSLQIVKAAKQNPIPAYQTPYFRRNGGKCPNNQSLSKEKQQQQQQQIVTNQQKQPIQECQANPLIDVEKIASLKAELSGMNEKETSCNFKIRLLEPEGSLRDIRNYLVEYKDGSLKVFTSIELVVAHPFQFIVYLQDRAHRNK